MAAIKYARVTLDEHGGRRRFFLRITGESDGFLRGVEVDKTGDAVVRRNKDGVRVDETTHIIDKHTIIKREPYVMNNTYAELEPQS